MIDGIKRSRSSVVIALAGSVTLSACAAETPDLSLRPHEDDGPRAQPPGVTFVEAGARETEAGAPFEPPGDGVHGMPVQSPSVSAPPPEPERDAALRLMHGVVDARFIYFCETDPEFGDIVTDALPQPAAGLELGQSFLVPSQTLSSGVGWLLVASEQRLPQGVSCEEVLAQAHTVAPPVDTPAPPEAGALSQPGPAASADAGVDAGVQAESGDAGQAPVFRDASVAESLVDGGAAPPQGQAVLESLLDASVALPKVNIPPLRVVHFAAFSAATLEQELSRVLVASGCVGGYPKAPEGVCGPDYERRLTTLTPMLATLSRQTRFDRLGVQFLNASNLPSATLRSEPLTGEEGTFTTIGTRVETGQIEPAPLTNGYDAESIGSPLERISLRVEEGNEVMPLYRTTWATALEDASFAGLKDGEGWTFVLVGSVIAHILQGVGAELDASATSGVSQFAGFQLVLIPNDPATQAPERDGGR